MKVIVDVCIIPLGEGASVSKQVAECQRIIRNSGLKWQMHAYGTNLEGDWDDVFAVIKKCHQSLHDTGVVRLSSSIRLGTRTDKKQSMEDKIRVVEEQLK